jgi:pimeloyl-ACP methyl ester carboxylesterase
MPGYGFSGKPTTTGWGPDRIARAWVELMRRLGYTEFVAQGGDWGALVVDMIGVQAPPELLGIHINMAGAVPPEIDKAAFTGAPPPPDLSAEERHAYDQLAFFYTHGLAYAQEMGNRPQTLYGIADSPVGLAAWILDHDACSHELIARVFDGQPEGLTRDDVLDNITLYGLTNTAVSASRLYWENKLAFFAPKDVAIPVAVASSPMISMQLRGVGQKGPTPSSSITTGSTRAATSPPGKSPNSLRPSSGPPSDHSGRYIDHQVSI